MSSDARIGTELAGYRIEALLGRGGMGVVYRAHDLALDRPVALKILAPELAADVRFRERFLRESRLAASLDHRSIVPVHDAGEVAGELYIAMRYVEGSDLKVLLRDEGALAPARALEIVEQVADALDAAHERGLVHRDVKPSNVLIDAHGHCYLADFGLSRRLGDAGAGLGTTQSLGTADYVAPEQIRGEEVDGRADLYSLGCLLHECLTGAPPFKTASDAATLFAHLEEEPPAPPGLEQVMRTALAKDPDERFQSGRELVEAARSALGLEPKRARWPLAVAAVGLALIGAALLAFFLTGGGGTKVDPSADALLRVDPATDKVVDTLPVGHKANAVAASGRYVWVTNAGDNDVLRIDPSSKRVLKLSAHGVPTGVATDGKTAVVADATEHVVTSYDVATGSERYTTPLAGTTNWQLPIASGSEGTWFADGAAGIAGRVDDTLPGGEPSERAVIPQYRPDFYSNYQSFDAVAVGEGAVWVAGDPFGRAIWRVDPRTGRVTAIPLGFIPKAIAAGEGAVWVTSLFGDTVSRIDTRTNRIVSTIHVGRGPDAIAAGGGGVWVTSSLDDTLTRIDPATNRVVARIPLGKTPRGVAVGPDGVWVVGYRSVPVDESPAIKIGVYADCSGQWFWAYDVSVAGAELPLIQHGARRPGRSVTDGVTFSIGGHPVKLFFGCDEAGGSNFDAVLREYRRLVERVGVDIMVGPTTGDTMLALQEYMRRHPETTFVNGSGAAPLQDPAPNFFNFYTDGAQWNAGLGAYAYRQLGWRRAVIIGDIRAARFTVAETGAFIAEFCSLGGTIVKPRIWIPAAANDLSATIAAIPRSRVDGFFVSTAGDKPVVAALANGYPGLRGINFSRRVVLSSAASSAMPTLLKDWRRATGLVYAAPGGGPGLAPGAKYLTDFRKAFPKIPSTLYGYGFFDLGYYDGMAATLSALERVHGDLSNGQRRFRAALARVSLDAPNGRVTVDARRRAVAPTYVYQVEGRKLTPRLIRTIPNVEPTFGGYFKATDPPPTKATPACVKRTPPPWAR